MVVLALLIPPVMLGVLLMLGRYEDLLLPPAPPEAEPAETGPVGLGQ